MWRLCLWLLLCAVLGDAKPNKAGVAYLKANKDKPGVVELPSGLQYKVLREGTGDNHPTVDSPCECHYKGTLIDGTQFDSSYDRGEPTTFAPNQVIKGWTEAMQMMVEGDKWEMYIPSDLAYGDRGSPPKIKGGDTLVFTMELLKIKGDKKPAAKCDPKSLKGCSDKEKAFIEKVGKKMGEDKEKYAAEVDRLKKIAGKSMTDESASWVQKRMKILTKLHDEL